LAQPLLPTGHGCSLRKKNGGTRVACGKKVGTGAPWAKRAGTTVQAETRLAWCSLWEKKLKGIVHPKMKIIP